MIRKFFKAIALFWKVNLLKTLRFNFHYFKLSEALKFPVIVFKGVELYNMEGEVKLLAPIRTGMVMLGSRMVSIFDRNNEFVWDVTGDVVFKGNASIGSGCKISVAENARLVMGVNFCISAHSVLDCNKLIEFGDNCLLSWDILIMDSDYHQIINDGKVINPAMDIVIGNHVWIGSGVTVLKGVIISDNIIVACRSLITKHVLTPNSIVSGNGRDIMVLKKEVNWEN